jgi:capsular exopolysaccharide synthesis family protein
LTNLVTLKDPRSAAAEAFRTLRTNILFAALDNPVHTLVVSSAAPEEGRADAKIDSKSVTVANLAVAMAQSGHRTILVDADLRRPSQHTLWNLGNENGLTSLMLEKVIEVSLTQRLLKPAPGVENLHILTSGPTPGNPADLFSARRMDDVIGSLKGNAEFVLFDAPPVLAATDTSLLAKKTDALLLVMKAGATRRDYAQRAKDTLDRLGVRILGVAFTNAPQDRSMNYGK